MNNMVHGVVMAEYPVLFSMQLVALLVVELSIYLHVGMYTLAELLFIRRG